MDNYLIDRETLGKFIDELIKHKPLNVSSAEQLNEFREQAIAALDEQIGMSIFSQFTPEQDDEYNQLLDRDASEEECQEFFNRHNIDLEKTISTAMQRFAEDFIGGTDA